MKGKKKRNNKTCGYRDCNRVIEPWEPRVYDVKKDVFCHYPCWWRLLEEEKRQKEVKF